MRRPGVWRAIAEVYKASAFLLSMHFPPLYVTCKCNYLNQNPGTKPLFLICLLSDDWGHWCYRSHPVPPCPRYGIQKTGQRKPVSVWRCTFSTWWPHNLVLQRASSLLFQLTPGLMLQGFDNSWKFWRNLSGLSYNLSIPVLNSLIWSKRKIFRDLLLKERKKEVKVSQSWALIPYQISIWSWMREIELTQMRKTFHSALMHQDTDSIHWKPLWAQSLLQLPNDLWLSQLVSTKLQQYRE